MLASTKVLMAQEEMESLSHQNELMLVILEQVERKEETLSKEIVVIEEKCKDSTLSRQIK